MVKSPYRDLGDIRVFSKGFAFNTKTYKYVGNYNHNGTYLVYLKGYGQVSLAKLIGVLFLKPDYITRLDEIIVIYKDNNRKNINLSNIRVIDREEYKKLTNNEKLKLKGNNVNHRTRTGKTVYLIDTRIDDYEETTIREIAERFGLKPSTISNYIKNGTFINNRYIPTYNYWEAVTYGFE